MFCSHPHRITLNNGTTAASLLVHVDQFEPKGCDSDDLILAVSPLRTVKPISASSIACFSVRRSEVLRIVFKRDKSAVSARLTRSGSFHRSVSIIASREGSCHPVNFRSLIG